MANYKLFAYLYFGLTLYINFDNLQFFLQLLERCFQPLLLKLTTSFS